MQVQASIEDFIKSHQAIASVIKQWQTEAEAPEDGLPAAMAAWDNLVKISTGSLAEKAKVFRALFAEGLMFYAATAKTQKSINSVRSQLALIAGEQVDRGHIHPALLKRAEELTES